MLDIRVIHARGPACQGTGSVGVLCLGRNWRCLVVLSLVLGLDKRPTAGVVRHSGKLPLCRHVLAVQPSGSTSLAGRQVSGAFGLVDVTLMTGSLGAFPGCPSFGVAP